MDTNKTNTSGKDGASGGPVTKPKAPRKTPYKFRDCSNRSWLAQFSPVFSPSYTVPELDKNFSCDTCSLVSTTMANNGKCRCFTFEPKQCCITVDQLIDECRPAIDAAFEEIVTKRIPIKANFGIQVLFCKLNFGKEHLTYMSVDAYEVLTRCSVERFIENAQRNIEEQIEQYTNEGVVIGLLYPSKNLH